MAIISCTTIEQPTAIQNVGQGTRRAARRGPSEGRSPTWTREIISGAGSSAVMSHPDAALLIQVPTLETTVAVHSTVNTR